MTDNNYITRHLLNEIHKEALPWLLRQNFTHVVTLAFNRNTSLSCGRKSLKAFHAKLDRFLLGSRWCKKPSSERSFFHAYPEHISSNFHYNMLLRVDDKHIGKTTSKIDEIWSSIIPSGSTDIKLTSESYDYENLVDYQIKDISERNLNYQEFLISTEFLSK